MVVKAMAIPLETIDRNMHDSMRNDAALEKQRREQMQKAAELQKMVWEQQQRMRVAAAGGGGGGNGNMAMAASVFSASEKIMMVSAKEQEANGVAVVADHHHQLVEVDAMASVRVKELEIEKRKSQVQGKVRAQLSRLESQGRRLEELKRELECLEDPTKRDVAEIRKKIESVDRDLKPLRLIRDKKEKELKEADQLLNEKNKLKIELVSKLMEIVNTSERQRLQKLDELNQQLEAMEFARNNA